MGRRTFIERGTCPDHSALPPIDR
uniref:Uncharacterized protein n=1 Tax=Romanomermis culicivorax TaxID=13658 RepID=A0A915JEI3_ROMCU